MLQVHNLSVTADGHEIIRDLSLAIPAGARVALMGPNGSGKSSFAAALSGHPGYVVEGTATWGTANLLELNPEERAYAGLFHSFQNPPSIPGVPVHQLIRLARTALETKQGRDITPLPTLIKELRHYCELLGLPAQFLERGSGEGMSGGEKKRLELLQLLALKPSLVILDEIDSGLDVDGLKLVATALNSLPAETTIILITHYPRLLEQVPVSQIHILKQGTLVKSGGPELVHEIETHGYAGL